MQAGRQADSLLSLVTAFVWTCTPGPLLPRCPAAQRLDVSVSGSCTRSAAPQPVRWLGLELNRFIWAFVATRNDHQK